MFMTYAHKTYLLIIPAILAVYCLSKKNMFLQKIYIFPSSALPFGLDAILYQHRSDYASQFAD